MGRGGWMMFIWWLMVVKWSLTDGPWGSNDAHLMNIGVMMFDRRLKVVLWWFLDVHGGFMMFISWVLVVLRCFIYGWRRCYDVWWLMVVVWWCHAVLGLFNDGFARVILTFHGLTMVWMVMAMATVIPDVWCSCFGIESMKKWFSPVGKT